MRLLSKPMSNYPWLKSSFDQIREDASADRLAHALLLSGIEGIGVPEFAGEIAGYRLCFNPIVSTAGGEGACGQCKACGLLNSGTHPDLRILEPEGAAQIIKVDQIRELVNFMSQTPQIGEWKVAIIRPAHRMNHNAANALLKVLEEPAGRSLLLLATERPQMLLPTVRSRCTHIRLQSPNEAQVKDYLASMNVDITANTDAIRKIGLKPLMITDWINTDLMSSWKMALSEISALENRQSNAVKAAQLLKDLNFSQLINWLIEYASLRMKNSIQAKASFNGFERYEQVYGLLLDTRRALDSGANPNAQLALESIFLDWPQASR